MQRWLIGVAVTAAVVVVASIAIGRRPEPAASRSIALPAGVAVNRRPPPVPLRDANGRPARLADLRGRWVALAPTLTECHEVCPITTGALLRLRSLIRRAGAGDRFAVAEVSVDPWRDSPARLRAYRRRTGANLPIYTGSLAALRRLWSFFGIAFRRSGNDVVHGDGLFLIDPTGRERVVLGGMPAVGGRLRPRLRSLLDAEGRANLAHPRAPWTPRQAAADLRLLMGLRASASALAPSARRSRRPLAGSPAPLAALHAQAGTLLPGEGLERRLRSLRGLPVVLNAWASWCPPCREELPLLSTAAAQLGRRVAFLGADVEDDAGAPRRLLAEVPVPYPSYETSLEALRSLAPARGTPFTVLIGRDGTVAATHIGAYGSEGELRADISSIAGS